MTREYIMQVQIDDDGHEYDMTRIQEVNLCRDCEHYINHRCYKVKPVNDWRMPVDFCSLGERKQ